VIPAKEQAQRQAAMRALLAKPLHTAADDGDALVAVRRHLTALSDWVRRETGWRLVADAETATAVLAGHTAGRLPRLAGEPGATPWDPGLADAMARRGVRVEEELSLDVLLADLA